MAVHVDDVVEVTRPATLGECSELLPEELGNRVAHHAFDWQGRVAERVANRPKRQPVDDGLVCGEIDLHLGRRGLRVRTVVGDPALGGRLASQVPASPERALVDGDLDA
ncbi:MAG TPA: hypothetical protein VM287_01675 [Egibacteraceae bacterium]|jgi:hypothetical protein|nr:hypothetical protein [Egibacteraceae bacterium]